ncbi:hypothetical protein PpBr36_09094 [Pyricularia pennisetigena]|uniref:hypothetical protein n=1 Tax=Pyricularia pennisetigena TaxID=1578925 RepID=UPI001150359E|nr:hypothetical protein PpBr36_09094 [Pyricularia pennisetigena]TLS24837.1 hypothetical protein PpBr36_09094 [Pyricularia pennisetigena]
MSGSGRFRALRPLDESTALQANEADAVREGSASSVSLSPILASSSSSAPVRTQNRTLSACLRCRRSKAKCTGTRPRCRRCSDNDVSCEYDADPDITPSLTVKRRNIELLKENQELRQVIAFMAMRPWQETEEVFQRLREGMDPLEVFSAIIAGRTDSSGGAVSLTAQAPSQHRPPGESGWESGGGLRPPPPQGGFRGLGVQQQQQQQQQQHQQQQHQQQQHQQQQQQQQQTTEGRAIRDPRRPSERLDIASLLS